jgi:glucose/mannose-6-phosphate isomerase
MFEKFNIKDLDRSDMFEILRDFPSQVEQACQIGVEAPFFNKPLKSNNFVLMGMGGSAIGGDLIRSYLAGIKGNKINLSISRSYNVPHYADETFNFIASSYSGGTEETLSSINQAIDINANILAITSGGTLESICNEKDIPAIKIPGGMMPRCAVGYSFFPLLHMFLKSDLIEEETKKKIIKSIEETQELLRRKKEIYSDFKDEEHNPALKIARILRHNVSIIYSGNELLDTVNLRWRGQIQENSKALAFGNVIPEMNHNEINSWILPEDLLGRFVAIYLFDRDYNKKIKERIFAVDKILSEKIHRTIKIESLADSLLARMFDILYLGDWVSFYLALLNEEDPTPIPLIMRLKEELASLV